jgi:hypothetical protein
VFCQGEGSGVMEGVGFSVGVVVAICAAAVVINRLAQWAVF